MQSLTAAHRARIGYVAEGQQLPPRWTLARLERYLAPLYPTWDAALAASLRERFQLDPSRALRTLSRGEHMKAALLCALAPRPELLLMDEPFTGMDAAVKDDLVRGVLELSGREGWTVVIASHDLAELDLLADWVGFLDHGRLQLHESMDTVRARYRWVEIMTSDLEARLPAVRPAHVGVGRAGRAARARARERAGRRCTAAWRAQLVSVGRPRGGARGVAPGCVRGAHAQSGRRPSSAGASSHQTALSRGGGVMSWTQQVWHVFRKDVWEQRWVLTLYVALLGLGTLQGTQVLATGGELESVLVVLGGMVLSAVAAFLAASVILGDSPTDVRAHWASLPYARSAVFGAKALVFAGLVLLGVIAFVPLLLSLAVSPAQLGLQLANFSAANAALIVASAAFAGMVARLRTVLLLPLASAMLLVGSVVFTARRAHAPSPGLPSWVLLAGIAGALALLAAVYRGRHVTRPRQGVVLLACACLLLGPLMVRGFSPDARVIGPARISGVTSSLSLAAPDSLQALLGRLPVLKLETSGQLLLDGTTPSARVELVTRTAVAGYANASDDVVALTFTRRLVDPPLPLGDDVRWIDPGTTASWPRGQSMKARVYGTRNDSAAMKNIVRVRAEGAYEFREPRLIGMVPATRDTAFSRDGMHVLITRTDFNGAPAFRVQTIALATPGESSLERAKHFNHVDFALVHDARREAITLNFLKHSSMVGGALLSPLGVSRGDALVVVNPGVSWSILPPDTTGITRAVVPPLDSASTIRALVTPEWLRGARLVIFEWVRTGTSPVTISSNLPRVTASLR